jgi:hypothetical protein
MGRRLAPHTIAWLDQVAALVRDHATNQPMSTNALASLLHLNPYEQGTRLWPALNRLANTGGIRRTKGIGGIAYWQWIS